MTKMNWIEDRLPETKNGEISGDSRRVFVNVKLADGTIKNHIEFRRYQEETGGAFTCFPGTWKYTGDNTLEFGIWAEEFQPVGDTVYNLDYKGSPVVAWEYSKNQTPDDPENFPTSSVLSGDEKLQQIIDDPNETPGRREAASLMKMLRSMGI